MSLQSFDVETVVETRRERVPQTATWSGTTAQASSSGDRLAGSGGAGWAALPAALIAGVIDAIACPLLLVDTDGAVLCANALGRQQLALQVDAFAPDRVRLPGELRPRVMRRLAAWRPDQPREWSMLEWIDRQGCHPVGLLPLGRSAGSSPQGLAAFGNLQSIAVNPTLGLLMLPCEPLRRSGARACFDRQHQLTRQEACVLDALCAGLSPTCIAADRRVAISTVRTQIASIRGKCGATNINHLLQQVAQLPPMAVVDAGRVQC